ncbi:Gp37Gp68 family protein [Neorhizobium galegae bv. officinalis bv. officinalis str. HAMBI 1141]|uniref:Gp37Gp68 family protein n=1 Tax=Neorhizobium galegae bv. officinalis bv. officinalis str. HAMBI 1141 TaxID=1028801 RepID=A0A068T224_NEOGA|nr:phage Gp37/Gp68 family protein [Neorhizobium galegae]CDN52502.1 Gp37Gp68 family protein [Neorhizobium galegae bv. officinalis bv. officinalis str. HAMBI 1141]
MAENSAISWTHHTWNPWMGCTKVSPACDGCYAEALMDKRYSKVKWGPKADRVRTGVANWRQPFRWQRHAEVAGDRPFVFCASLADIFDNQVDPQWRTEAFDVMRRTPNLVYLLLTKRPQNIVKLSDAAGGLPANAALGTTTEDQKRADYNFPALKVARIELRPLFTFGSLEPVLGPTVVPREYMPDWIITGGESDQIGHPSRPTHPDWFRSLRDQSAAAGIPFHHKQNGEWLPWRPIDGNPDRRPIAHVMQNGSEYYPGNFSSPLQSMIKVGKSAAGRLLDGVEHNAFPEVAQL